MENKKNMNRCSLRSCVHFTTKSLKGCCNLSLSYTYPEKTPCISYRAKENIQVNQLPYWYTGSTQRKPKSYCNLHSCAHFYQVHYHQRCRLGLQRKSKADWPQRDRRYPGRHWRFSWHEIHRYHCRWRTVFLYRFRTRHIHSYGQPSRLFKSRPDGNGSSLWIYWRRRTSAPGWRHKRWQRGRYRWPAPFKENLRYYSGGNWF